MPPALAAYQYDRQDSSISLYGYLQGEARYALDDDTPDEDPSQVLNLDLRANLGSWNSMMLVIKGIDDGKVIDPGSARLFNEFDRIYQDRNPSVDIDEAYIDLYTRYMDVRLGIQKFAWGRLDEINPTDNLNTEDLTRGGTDDEVERKIGAPSLKVSMFSGIADIEMVWIPRYVPYRLPNPQERWFPEVMKPPAVIETETLIGEIPVLTTYHDIDLPALNVRNSGGGVRVSGYIAGVDLSLSYFTGYDPMPVTDAATDITVTLEDVLALSYDIDAHVDITPRISRIHVFGFDLTTTVGSFTIRGEGAYFKDKIYNRKLSSVLAQELAGQRQEEMIEEFMQAYISSGGTDTARTFHVEPDMAILEDSMKYGAGIDYIYGDTSVSLQCIQEYMPGFDEDKPVYFIKDGVDTVVTASFKQFFMQNTLEINLDAAHDIQFRDIIFKPSVKYSFTDNLQMCIGAILIEGKYDDALLGQFRDNDEAFAWLRCNF